MNKEYLINKYSILLPECVHEWAIFHLINHAYFKFLTKKENNRIKDYQRKILLVCKKYFSILTCINLRAFHW